MNRVNDCEPRVCRTKSSVCQRRITVRLILERHLARRIRMAKTCNRSSEGIIARPSRGARSGGCCESSDHRNVSRCGVTACNYVGSVKYSPDVVGTNRQYQVQGGRARTCQLRLAKNSGVLAVLRGCSAKNDEAWRNWLSVRSNPGRERHMCMPGRWRRDRQCR